jgi:hypothetical protein
VTPARPQTAPHDYRVVCECEPAPTVVGGQAVNLWAINYLTPEVPKTNLVSKDLDIVVSKEALTKLKQVPGWIFQPRETRNWMDSRLGALRSTSPDGRPLLVEILHSVHGLDKADLDAAAYVKSEGVVYRVLDPVAMLKAKTANVRDIDQVGPPVRQDRLHLQLIVRCVPEFLRDVHQSAVMDPSREKEALTVVSRAFKTLQNAKTAQTLQAEGLAPASLIPAELAASPLPRIRSAFEWQFRLLATAPEKSRPGMVLDPEPDPAPKPSQGPRMGM